MNTLPTTISQPIYGEDGQVLDGYQSIIASEDDGNKLLSVMKQSYHPLHNQDFVRLARAFSHEVSGDVTFASHRGGKSVVAFVDMGSTITPSVTTVDHTKRYITLINSHDGLTGLSLGNFAHTFSCKNKLSLNYNNSDIKIKHTSSMMIQVEHLLEALPYSNKIWEQFLENVELLNSVKLNWHTRRNAVQHMYNAIGIGDIDLSNATNAEKKKMVDLSRSIVSEIEDKGDTLWGMFNAFTKYTTHEMGSRNREQSKILGAGRAMDNDVLSMLIKEAELSN